MEILEVEVYSLVYIVELVPYTFNNFSDEIKIDQNSVFLSANTIIAEKTIFVLNAVFQIIQLETVNSLLISIKHL